MSRHLSGTAYTNIPVNASGVQTIIYPTDHYGDSSSISNQSILSGAAVTIIYGVVVTNPGNFTITFANAGTTITTLNFSTAGEVMFGEQGIEVRGGMRIAIPANSTATGIVFWKRIV